MKLKATRTRSAVLRTGRTRTFNLKLLVLSPGPLTQAGTQALTFKFVDSNSFSSSAPGPRAVRPCSCTAATAVFKVRSQKKQCLNLLSLFGAAYLNLDPSTLIIQLYELELPRKGQRRGVRVSDTAGLAGGVGNGDCAAAPASSRRRWARTSRRHTGRTSIDARHLGWRVGDR